MKTKKNHKLLLLILSLKNLSRHRRRTIITAIAIAAGTAIYIATTSLIAGFSSESDRNLKEFELGNVGIFAMDYWAEKDQHPLDHMLENPQATLDALRAQDIPAVERLNFKGELIIHYDPFPEDGSIPMQFSAIDPQEDDQVFHLKDTLIEGRWLEDGDEILIGRWLADKIGAEVGYYVSVTTRTRDGFRQLMDFQIVGIFESFNPQIDRKVLYIPLDTAHMYLETGGAVNTIHALLPENQPGTADVQPIRDILQEALPAESQQIEVLSFAQMNEEMAALMQMSDTATGILLFLLGIIAVVGVSNTMLMSVMERQKEIGTMRALGFRNGEIRQLFMLEAAGIGLIGAIGGLIIGAILVGLMVNVGIDYGFLLEDADMEFRLGNVLHGVWNTADMLNVAIFAFLFSGLVALFPVRNMLGKQVTENLRQ